jgi:peptidoglycan/LPS O-acetylase OafA/YrhL
MAHTPRVRLLEIEGLRAVAAWSIVVFHVWVFTSPAVLGWNLGPLTAFVSPLQSGVTLFFVLSGFLLYRPIAAALIDGTKTPRTTTYLRNRMLRIVPAYWVILMVVVFAFHSATAGASGRGVLSGSLTDPKTFVLDLLLVQTYLPHAIWSGILPSWSLTIEAAFYLLLPVLGVCAMWFARGAPQSRMRIAAASGPVIAMILFGAIGKTLVATLSSGSQRATVSSWHGVLDRSILTHADLFGFGMAAALVLLLWERGSCASLRPLLARQLGRPLAYLGLPVFVLGYYLLAPYAYDAVVALLVAVALLRLLGGEATSNAQKMRRFLRSRWTLAAGRHSYSVFLWNYPLLAFLSAQGLLAGGHGAGAFVANLAVAAPVIAVLSMLTYRFVEAPALRLKQRESTASARVVPVTPAA